MPTATNGIDWNATAAWIALVISIISAGVGPIVTALINNHHQLKMRKLDIEENRIMAEEKAKRDIIQNFVANVGKCIASKNTSDISDFGYTYFSIYQYLPKSEWETFTDFYSYVINKDWENADASYKRIITGAVGSLTKSQPKNRRTKLRRLGSSKQEA